MLLLIYFTLIIKKLQFFTVFFSNSVTFVPYRRQCGETTKYYKYYRESVSILFVVTLLCDEYLYARKSLELS